MADVRGGEEITGVTRRWAGSQSVDSRCVPVPHGGPVHTQPELDVFECPHCGWSLPPSAATEADRQVQKWVKSSSDWVTAYLSIF